MKIDNQYPERSRSVLKIIFTIFYFLNVYISLTTSDPNLKLYPCITNIAVEGTLSQIFDNGSGSFYKKSRNKYSQKIYKKLPVF